MFAGFMELIIRIAVTFILSRLIGYANVYLLESGQQLGYYIHISK